MNVRLTNRKNLVALALLALVVFSLETRAERLRPAGDHNTANLADSKRKPQEPRRATEAQEPMERIRAWVRSQAKAVLSYFEGSWSSTAPRRPTLANESGQVGKLGGEPRGSMPRKLEAPRESFDSARPLLDPPGVTRKSSGLASYRIDTAQVIPQLSIEREPAMSGDRFALEPRIQKLLEDRLISFPVSPEMVSEKELKALIKPRAPGPDSPAVVRIAGLPTLSKMTTDSIERIVLNLQPEKNLSLKTIVPLTLQEQRFLSALSLLKNGDRCPSAIGLFHQLAKDKSWRAEASYYLAQCSRQMKLITDQFENAEKILETGNAHYGREVLAQLGPDVPSEVIESLGVELLKFAGDANLMSTLGPQVQADLAFILAEFGVATGRYQTALIWSKRVPESHRHYLKAQFLRALAEYQAGSKEEAVKIQDRIVNAKEIEASRLEFQALVALNAGRMQFQEGNFKSAHEYFRRVYKDHPLWLQSLTELGWSQLMHGDIEGAIGNMHSIQSPFFQKVYKPESYVIRTIGYLNICQYGDAYRTLSILEKEYRPMLEQIEKYLQGGEGVKPSYYETVRNFIKSPNVAGDIDGLPSVIVREMARHRDFTNLQKSLNRLLDERAIYTQVQVQTDKDLKSAEALLNGTNAKVDTLRKQLALFKRGDSEKSRMLSAALEAELEKQENQIFWLEILKQAKSGADVYRAEMISRSEKRTALVRERIEQVLANRLLRMKVDLARMLDNNELLRYEVFAASGENIRFQVAGGAVAERIPASVLPKSKALQWSFDGEYWEDEIGHFRSSLKNNCPEKADGQMQARSS